MIPMRVAISNANPETTTTILARAVVKATNLGVPIINLSYSVEVYDHNFVTAAESYNGLIVCSAGNKGTNINNDETYKKLNEHGNAIIVANSQADDSLNVNSNHGFFVTSLAAPGTGIYSTQPNNKYGTMTGASMAAPHVTGAAALLLSVKPSLTTQELKNAILDNVDLVPALDGEVFTGGRLNVFKAFKSLFLKQVHGYVYPIVTQELIPGFTKQHEITVELRKTFLTPATGNLSTVAEPYNILTKKGEFTFENVLPGNYVLHIKRPGYLIRAMNITISYTDPQIIELTPPGVVDNGIFNLWWGNCNGDYLVDNLDVMMIMGLMSAGVNLNHPLYNPSCDLNADGLFDQNDIDLVFDKWGCNIGEYAGSSSVNFFS
jgi:hypothetical protein